MASTTLARVYVFQNLGRNEGELVESDADNFAVLLMKSLDFVVELANNLGPGNLESGWK
jgi:hypothetical protein